jgi:hypothetical protein
MNNNILENINDLILEVVKEDSAAQNKEYKVIARTKFILHRHDANRAGIHYDLRLQQLDGDKKVLSFAIPKADIPGGREKYLAVTNFLHEPKWVDIDDIDIPEGYGAGRIELLEKGTMDIYKWDKKNNITFSFNGKHLKGIYHIIRAKFKGSDKDNQYLFFAAK